MGRDYCVQFSPLDGSTGSYAAKDVKWTNTVQLPYSSAGLGWVEYWYCHHQQSETQYK